MRALRFLSVPVSGRRLLFGEGGKWRFGEAGPGRSVLRAKEGLRTWLRSSGFVEYGLAVYCGIVISVCVYIYMYMYRYVYIYIYRDIVSKKP